MLEAGQYSENAFATLTYEGECDPSVNPRHLQLFLKRLRKAYEPHRFRFYAVGEYGDESQRPHYHAALFNVPTCVRGRTRRKVGSTRAVWRGCCVACELVGEAWGHGDVDLGVLETSSAQYVAGYVTKKMTRRDDPRLNGRHPEFARMSLRPGIGADAVWEVASALLQYGLDEKLADVPVSLRHGSKELPLGRYLRRRLRESIGKDKATPAEVLEALQAELLPVRLAAKASEENPSFKAQLVEASRGELDRFHARRKIFRKEWRTL